MPRGGSVGSGQGSGGGRSAAESIGEAASGGNGGQSAGGEAASGGTVGPGAGGGGERGREGGRYGGGGNQAGRGSENGSGGETRDRQDRAREARAQEAIAAQSPSPEHPDVVHGLRPRQDPPPATDERNRAVAAALAAAQTGPTALDRIISAVLALALPGGLGLRGAGILPSPENLMQNRVDGMLGLGGEPGLMGQNEGEGGGDDKPPEGPQPQEDDEGEDDTQTSPASLLARLQDIGTRGYLDQLQRQNINIAEQAAAADPGAAVEPIDLYATFMEEGRRRNIAAIDSLIGITDGTH